MADKPRSTVGTASSLLEMLYGSLSGLAFGLISPLASQPFDTMKTKMQADARFAGQSVFAVARNVPLLAHAQPELGGAAGSASHLEFLAIRRVGPKRNR